MIFNSNPLSNNMNKILFTLMTGGMALLAAFSDTPSTLARKTGGAPQRLQQKQHKGCSQNQQNPALARKVGDPKTRLLYQAHRRGQA